ncbi:hypothetical protein D3C76_1284230 [compost metagenome]
MINIDIEYPSITLPQGRLIQIKINRYYQDLATKFYRYSIDTLLPAAIDQYESSLKDGFPFNAYEVVMKYTVTLNYNCTLSTYFDQYQYTGGAHGNTLRLSNTWNLQTGNTIRLKDLFSDKSNYKDTVIKQVQIQAKENLIKNPGIYFENYEDLIVQNFNEDNFYLTQNSVNIYYQQYDIAPYSTGIVVFDIPYSDLGVKSPKCKL